MHHVGRLNHLVEDFWLLEALSRIDLHELVGSAPLNEPVKAETLGGMLDGSVGGWEVRVNKVGFSTHASQLSKDYLLFAQLKWGIFPELLRFLHFALKLHLVVLHEALLNLDGRRPLLHLYLARIRPSFVESPQYTDSV